MVFLSSFNAVISFLFSKKTAPFPLVVLTLAKKNLFEKALKHQLQVLWKINFQ